MKVLSLLLSLLYPRKCPFCRRVIDENKLICPACEKKLPYITDKAPRHFAYVDECYSALEYSGAVPDSIRRFKFHGAAAYAEIYGTFLAKCIDENGIFCDIITWVPLSRARLRQRGYDQAKLLAEALAGHMGLEAKPLLKKTRNNKAQSGLRDEHARRTNVKGVYALAAETTLEGKRIVLIDDVVTTGATMSECAGILKKAGAAELIGLTVASAGK